MNHRRDAEACENGSLRLPRLCGEFRLSPRSSPILSPSSFILRMSRPTRIAGSFAIVMIAYWAYALLAVPWIEPSTAPLAGPRTTGPAGDLSERTENGVAKDFPRRLLANHRFHDSREPTRPSWCSRDITTSPTAGSRSSPARSSCSPTARATRTSDSPVDHPRRAGGAVLQFDPPLDLTHAKLGRLVAGRLNGEVVIRSDMKNPGPEKRLKIVTRDVELTPQAITTPYRVEFSWGPNRGCGPNMVVRLLTDPAPVATGINILGMESIELRHVEYLHFELEQAMATSRTDANSGATDATDKSGCPAGSAEGSGKRETTPIGVCCQGPFRFNAVKRVATFRDDVQVTRLNSGGPPDQISCQLLSLFTPAQGHRAGAEALHRRASRAADPAARGDAGARHSPRRRPRRRWICSPSGSKRKATRSCSSPPARPSRLAANA